MGVLLMLVGMGMAFTSSAVVYAVDPLAGVCDGVTSDTSATCASQDTTTNPLTGSDGILYRASIIVSVVAGIAAVIMIIISGFHMITSGGDAQKVASARRTLIGSVVGLVIIALAQSIIMFVIGRI